MDCIAYFDAIYIQRYIASNNRQLKKGPFSIQVASCVFCCWRSSLNVTVCDIQRPVLKEKRLVSFFFLNSGNATCDLNAISSFTGQQYGANKTELYSQWAAHLSLSTENTWGNERYVINNAIYSSVRDIEQYYIKFSTKSTIRYADQDVLLIILPWMEFW